MSHHRISIDAIAHGAEACLALLHLFDHGKGSEHQHHYDNAHDPISYRGNMWIVETCGCGAVRRTLLAYDADQHCIKRTYQGIDYK